MCRKIVSPTAVRLTLPQKRKAHPTFHVPEIEPFVAGSKSQSDHAQTPREVADIEADEDCDVDKIKRAIARRKKILYRVKLLGYPVEEGLDIRAIQKPFRRSPCEATRPSLQTPPGSSGPQATRDLEKVFLSRFPLRQKADNWIADIESPTVIDEAVSPKFVSVPCYSRKLIGWHKKWSLLRSRGPVLDTGGAEEAGGYCPKHKKYYL